MPSTLAAFRRAHSLTQVRAAAALRGQQAEIARLRAALAPFAAAAADLDDSADDKHHLWESAAAMGLTAGHLRAAAKALKP
jgi:hypothetical protein